MTDDDQQLQNEIISLTDSAIEPVKSFDIFRKKLSAFVNDLAANDFMRLVGLLYRLDVSESKLKKMLAENTGEDAGDIIADAIIKRQEEKIKSRRAFSRHDNNIAEDEKW